MTRPQIPSGRRKNKRQTLHPEANVDLLVECVLANSCLCLANGLTLTLLILIFLCAVLQFPHTDKKM